MIGIKNKLFLLLLSYLCEASVPAQNTKPIDSLFAILKMEKQDTSKINILNELSNNYINYGNYTQARVYADSALALASHLNFKRGKAIAYRNIGTINDYQGSNEEALRNYQAGLRIYQEIGNKKGIAEILGNIGVINDNQGKYSEALKNYEAALKIGEEIGYKHIIASSFANIGAVYGKQGNYFEALKNFQNAYKISEEIEDKYVMASSLNRMGIAYSSQGNYSDALKKFQLAQKIFQEIGNKEGIAGILINLGAIYYNQENYPEALKNYQACLNLFQEIGDKNGMAIALNNIGVTYEEQENYPEALKNQQGSLKIFQEIGDKEGIALSYNGLAGAYRGQKNFQEALNYLFTSLTLYDELENKEGIAYTNVDIGALLSKQAAAQDSFAAKQKFTEAIQYFTKGLELAKEIGNKEIVWKSYQGLTETYEGLKDYQKALEYQKLYKESKDSLLNSETTHKLEQLRTQFEVEKAIADENARHQLQLGEEKAKKEKAIEIEKMKYQFVLANEKTEQEKTLAQQKFESEKALANENARHQQAMTEQKTLQAKKDAEAKLQLEKEKADRKRKNELLLTGLGILALTSLFIALFIRQRNQKRMAIERAETLHKMAELELQSLRAQLNPHFMFNSLNAIQDLIVNEDNDRSHLYLSRFSKLLRMLLDNANQPFVSVKQEIEFLELYLSLENLRIPDLKFSIEKDPQINTEERMIPNMMLQPYIENAIWHGLSNKKGERRLQVRIRETGNVTAFEIEDNGIGRKKATELKKLYRRGHHSKGMELLSKRFNLLSKEYGASIHTTVTDLQNNGDANGTLVQIDVPFSLSQQAKKLVHDTNYHN